MLCIHFVTCIFHSQQTAQKLPSLLFSIITNLCILPLEFTTLHIYIYIYYILLKDNGSVRVDNTRIEINQGVRQRCLLSPLLFNIYIDVIKED
jgi:hypothetical protein